MVSDNFKARGLAYARKNRIIFRIIRDKNKKLFEKKLLNYLNKHQIEFICLAGFMKILSKSFIDSFGYKIINLSIVH